VFNEPRRKRRRAHAPLRRGLAGCGAVSLPVGRVGGPVVGDVGGAAMVAQELVAVR
jgi:hypothetical protein